MYLHTQSGKQTQHFLLPNLIFGRQSPFRGGWGGTDTPVLNFRWRLAWVSKSGWITFYVLSCLCDPQIHLWCKTCWKYRGPHGSWVFSKIEIQLEVFSLTVKKISLFDPGTCRRLHQQWWRFWLGLEPTTLYTVHSATPAPLKPRHWVSTAQLQLQLFVISHLFTVAEAVLYMW